MIRFGKVDKRLGDRAVLRDLTFTVNEGDVYGLLGPNGAGKTTAINILCGLLSADSGVIKFRGEAAVEESRYQFGIVPQEISLYRDLTCEENLGFYAELYGLRGGARRERVGELIELFRLDEYARTRIALLSGGWQRRINIAVGLVHSPALLILDEPTAGLDIEARHELWDLIRRLNAAGVTMLLTTHQLDEAQMLCSRIGILQEGRMAAEGTLQELREIVPAAQIAVVEAAEEGAVCQRADSMGWGHRRHGGRLNLLLPTEVLLGECVDAFRDLSLSSVALQPVGLEHVYMEVKRDRMSASAQAG